MLFNSIHFLFFFPLVTLVYFVIPKKIKWVWLLITSYYFYMSWNAQYALLMLTSTIITYLSGLLIEKARNSSHPKKQVLQKLFVGISFASNLAILIFFKYFDFIIENVNAALSFFQIQLINPSFDVLLPVGISFYTFQALSYTVDIYRNDLGAEKNFFKYALFVSFFRNWLPVQLNVPHRFFPR